MEKLKIGFNPTTAWDVQLFKDLMKDISLDADEIELYLLTTDDRADYIADVEAYLPGLKASYTLATTTLLVDKINELGMDIYLDADIETVLDVNNTEEAIAITVDPSIPDRFKIQPKYVTNLQFWIKQLSRL